MLSNSTIDVHMHNLPAALLPLSIITICSWHHTAGSSAARCAQMGTGADQPQPGPLGERTG